MTPISPVLADVRAAAGGQIEAFDVDQAQGAVAVRFLAERQPRGLVGASRTGSSTGRSSQTIAIGLVLGGRNLGRRRLAREIDRRAHRRRDGN